MTTKAPIFARAWLWIILITGFAVAARSQPLPLGNPAIVNSVLAGTANSPSIGRGSGDQFRIAWQQFYAGTQVDIRSRRLQPNGAFGAEATLNLHTPLNQIQAVVTMNTSNDWAVIWNSFEQAGEDEFHLFSRRTTSDGTILSGELPIDDPSTTPSVVHTAAVSMDESDELAAAWIDSTEVVHFRRFDAEGDEIAEFPVGTTSWDYRGVAVASLGLDRSVVAWTDYDEGLSEGVFIRCAGTNGPLGPAVRAHAETTGLQAFPQLAASANGRFALLWYTTDRPSWLYVRLFDRDCEPMSEEIAVAPGGSLPGSHQLGMAPDGAFVIAWATSANEAIPTREFTKSGVPVGDPFPALGAAFGEPSEPAVAVSDRLFAVVWNAPDFGPDGLDDIVVRRFVRRVVFTDDFETQDVSEWSTAAPE